MSWRWRLLNASVKSISQTHSQKEEPQDSGVLSVWPPRIPQVCLLHPSGVVGNMLLSNWHQMNWHTWTLVAWGKTQLLLAECLQSFCSEPKGDHQKRLGSHLKGSHRTRLTKAVRAVRKSCPDSRHNNMSRRCCGRRLSGPPADPAGNDKTALYGLMIRQPIRDTGGRLHGRLDAWWCFSRAWRRTRERGRLECL